MAPRARPSWRSDPARRTHVDDDPGTLAQWGEWTSLPFDATGPIHVPGALVPVMCATEHDYAVYVEPNVWVHHPLGR